MKIPAILYFTLFWVCFSHGALSQEQTYTGVYSVNQYEGLADFSYKVTKGDTLLDGHFSMKQSNAKALFTPGGDAYFSFVGTFKDNLPQGDWKLVFGGFIASQSSNFEDDAYQVLLNGTKLTVSGNLIDGKPEGKWVYRSNRLADSEVEELLFTSTIDFGKGIPQKSFHIENESMSMVGRFLRDGLAHDVWELYGGYSTDASEKWFFSEGLLEQIVFSSDEQIDTLQFFDQDTQEFQVVNLDLRYIHLLEMYQFLTGQPSRLEISQVNNMLVENSAYYKKIDDILSSLGDSKFMPEFKVKAPYFPFSEVEITLLKAIQKNFNGSRAISKRILESSQVQILKLSNESISVLVSEVESVDEMYNDPVKQFLTFNNLEVLEFAVRDSLVGQILDDRNGELGLKADGTAVNVGLKRMEKISNVAFEKLDSLQKEIQGKLTLEQRQKEQEVLESELLAQITQLNTLIDSLQDNSEKPVDEMLVGIKSNAKGKLKDYASINDINQQSDQAVALTGCFKEMKTLALTASSLTAKQQEIKELYTERVWNPFTATLMDEEQKRAITSSYQNVLIPFFLKTLTRDFDCAEIEELTGLIESSFQQILELKEGDTKLLERKLKNEKNPQKVLDLFSLHLSASEN